MSHDRADRPRSPATALIADASEAGLILEEQAPSPVRGESFQRRLEEFREFFLNSSWVFGWALGCRGRGPSLRQPWRRSSRYTYPSETSRPVIFCNCPFCCLAVITSQRDATVNLCFRMSCSYFH